MNRVFTFVALLFLIASCTSEMDQFNSGPRGNPSDSKTVFLAMTEGPAITDTKVYADESLKVLWNADDRISIFDFTTYNYQYAFTGDDGDTAGGFEEIPVSGYITAEEVSYAYAAYPYNKATKLSRSGVLTMVLPEEQYYKADSFGIGANTMVAVTDGNFLAFKNVGGYLSFRFYGDDVKVSSITIKGNNGEKISGKATITIPLGGTPTIAVDEENAKEAISLICNPPVTLGSSSSDYTTFWFVIPPTTLTNGFTVTVVDNQGKVFVKSSTKALTISRNQLEWMLPLKVTCANPESLNGNGNFEGYKHEDYVW